MWRDFLQKSPGWPHESFLDAKIGKETLVVAGWFFSRLPPIFLGGTNHPKMGQLRLVLGKSWGTLVALSQFLGEVGTIYCHFAV